MINMDVKGITWVGNIYKKIEDMCLEAEDMICEDTVKYIENQMQAVGASVRKLCSDVMQDLLPPSSCDLDKKEVSELPKDQYTFKDFKERVVTPDTKQTIKDSRIDHHVDNDAIHAASYDEICETNSLLPAASRNSVKRRNFISHPRKYVGSMDIKSNIGIDENQADKKMTATKIFDEIMLAETDTCRTSQSCEISNENQNQNHAVSVSKPASAEVIRLASAADCCNEIENVSTEHPLLDKSAEEKQMNMRNSSSGVLFGEPDDFSIHRAIQCDDCSYSMEVLSHPEQGRKTMQQDHLKLEETCVMVTRDELQFVPRAGGNLKTKKKKRQAFSLSKKSARKQEYEDLAVWHGSSQKVKGDCVENLGPASLEDQKKLLLSSMSEPEWELL